MSVNGIYKKMINIEKITEFLKAHPDQSFKSSHIMKELSITSKERNLVRALLRNLIKTGEVVRMSNQYYKIAPTNNIFHGVYKGYAGGKGVVLPYDAEQEKIFIKSRNKESALSGDHVVVQLVSSKDEGVEGKILSVIKRVNSTIVGRYSRTKNGGFVFPRNEKLDKLVYIPRPYTRDALSDGDYVVTNVKEWGRKDEPMIGEIGEILGKKIDETDITLIFKEAGVKMQFPEPVIKASEQIPEEISQDEISKRTDFRNHNVFTIDGDDAKDFDDAISIKKTADDKFDLWVHIADVSHYVREKSLIDTEAFDRGTSIYPLNMVIPMLPERLSNNVCSLKPNVDRLTMSVYMLINKDGIVEKSEFYNSIIRSANRLTYKKVQLLLDGDQEMQKELANVKDDLFVLRELAKCLNAMRVKRGSIEMEIPAVEIDLDKDGKPTNVYNAQLYESNGIIEESMLITNETVAQKIDSMKIPMLYRVHEAPAERKLRQISPLLAMYGIELKKDLTSYDLQEILDKSKKETFGHIIQEMILRSMMRAEYRAVKNIHFGLASQCYTHFTSPIRRYPDLVIHRILKEIIEKKMLSESRIAELSKMMPITATQSSETERFAQDVERKCTTLKALQFMQDKIGEEYKGIISGVMAFGFFVELEKYPIEGLVTVKSIKDDYFKYDEDTFSLMGEKTKQRFNIGQEVLVSVKRVDLEKLDLDFDFIEMSGENRPVAKVKKTPRKPEKNFRRESHPDRVKISRNPKKR